MDNLRAQVEIDLADTLEGEFSSSVDLIDPDGLSHSVRGQVLYFVKRVDPETGEVIIVDQPVVTLRISSLTRVPTQGETWYIKMPVSPLPGAAKRKFLFTPTRSLEHGKDIGFIRIYPQTADQESGEISS